VVSTDGGRARARHNHKIPTCSRGLANLCRTDITVYLILTIDCQRRVRAE